MPASTLQAARRRLMDEVALPAPRFGVIGRVAELEPLSASVMAVRVELAASPLVFAPGQYVALTLPGQPARDYSLTWRSEPGLLEFFVRDHGGGGTSSFVAERLRLGDVVRFDGPFGAMARVLEHVGPLLCIAASTGIGPVAAIAAAAGELLPDREVQLVWGGANAKDLFLIDEVAGILPGNGALLLSADDEEGEESRMICSGTPLDLIADHHDSLSGWAVAAAGPPAMVEAAADLVQSLGVDPDSFHADAFFTQRDKQASR
jgi:naphthalene 1,2-dioxygenase ferredoxin reductase component